VADHYLYATVPVGSVFVVDMGGSIDNSRILQLFPGGAQNTVAGNLSDAQQAAVAPNGDLYVALRDANEVVKVPADGGPEVAVGSGITYPTAVAVDGHGDVFIGAQFNRVPGVIELPAGGGPQSTIASNVDQVDGLAVDAEGDVFISEGPNSVLKVSPSGAMSTAASGFNEPEGVAVDPAGDLFVADSFNNQVVKITPGGVRTTIGSGIAYPQGVALDAAGDVFIADGYPDLQVREVPAGGGPETTLGSAAYPVGVAAYAPAPTFTADGPPASAPQGQAYSYTYTARTPINEPPATFALATGHLPPGLSLNRVTGVLSGTPTAAGVYTFTVETENAAQATVGRTTTIATTPPTVTSVSPDGGPVAGGTSVTIVGTGFVPGAVVEFGSQHAASVTVVSSTRILATAPAAGSAGVVRMHVRTAGGSSTQAVSYAYGPPTVTSVSPDGGPVAGGTSVTIVGTGFVPGAVVEFGSQHAASVTVVSSTRILATAPAAGSAGVVRMHVRTAGGSTPASGTPNQYTYR
jgi:hypothetical protein